jgi:hypothetical protein
MRAKRLGSLVLIAVLVAGCATHRATERQPGPDDRLGADVANIWYAPGRTIVCGFSALLAGLTMTLTFGQDYEAASQLMHGGCSEPWTVKPQDIREAVADR